MLRIFVSSVQKELAGIFGHEYGREDADGRSATHREFDRATELGKTRLVYVKGAIDATRHPNMSKLIQQAGAELIRKRFASAEELIAGVYASLIRLTRRWTSFFRGLICGLVTVLRGFRHQLPMRFHRR